jgi:nifR3 family TIM-barrel protein
MGMSQLEPAFFIQTIPVHGRLILAPMDGISDLPFRSLCRQFGSAISYSSFVGAIEILQDHPKAWRELEFLPEERPVALQIFDNSVERLVQAAQRIVHLSPDIIDINMGCSARRVSGRGAGAGLLREPKKIGAIISTLTRNLDLPITAKIRLGWDDNSLNYVEVAKTIEDNGGSLIAVHARTKDQAYGGRADWDAIAEIKEVVGIPIIGNGDIEAVEDIDRLFNHTGCDAIMIGRAAIGNPWIFEERRRSEVPTNEVAKTISTHLEKMLTFYGLDRGLILFRKHLKRYLRPMNLDPTILRALLTTNDLAKFSDLMNEIRLPQPNLKIRSSGAPVG